MAFYKLQTLEQFIGIFVSYRKSNFYASLWFFVALFFGELLMYPIVKIIGKKFESENKNKVALTIFGIFLSYCFILYKKWIFLEFRSGSTCNKFFNVWLCSKTK